MLFSTISLSLATLGLVSAQAPKCQTSGKKIRIDGEKWHYYCNTALVNGTYPPPDYSITNFKACFTHCATSGTAFVAAGYNTDADGSACICYSSLGDNHFEQADGDYAGFPPKKSSG